MSLQPGTPLGPYRIEAAIGAGGMGEVYRARDTRLDRVVAIKVLPEQFASDRAFRDRFDREARTIGGLNHPHICTLYDIGHEQGVDFLVLEYLEGQTLADRIARGPVPVAETLALAIQIGNALDKAHALGIVHRDLKPGNVMITKAGAKLLDFGLAKTGTPIVAGSSFSMLPTTPPNLTAQGTILGTFQYMAPEQLEGQEADARTDLFAFGTLLYEMLTGRKAFEAKTQAGLIGAILEREPTAATTIQPAIPPALEWVIGKCLEKDPAKRWQTARDLVSQLEWIARGGSQVSTPAPVAGARRRGPLVAAWSVAAALAIATLLLAFLYVRRPDRSPAPVRFQFSTATADMSFGGGAGPFPVPSPDGRHIVFWATVGGQNVLAVRSLDTLQTRLLAGTEGAGVYTFWSPDSRFVGFFGQGKLKKIEIAGGPPQTLCDAPIGEGGTWNPDGTIVFAPTLAGLAKVSGAGGPVTPVTQLDSAQKEQAHVAPWFLPDGRHFLFVAGPPLITYVGSLDSSDRVKLMATDSKVIFAAGHLLFVRGGTLLAQPFDNRALAPTGDAFPIAENVAFNPTNARASFGVSGDRVLTYRTGAVGALSALTVYDRTGKATAQVGPPGDYRGLDVSPDGTRVVVHVHADTGGDIWVLDSVRGTNSRFTFDASRHYAKPVWAADGTRILYASTGSKPAIFEKPAGGGGSERTLMEGGGSNQGPTHLSRDGHVLYTIEGKGRDVWALPLSGESPKPFPVLNSEFHEDAAALSPDGQWMVYQSNESGRFEVYVQPFPLSGGKWQISTTGGDQPRWRADGKELYYLDPGRNLMAVDVQVAADQFRPGVPKTLFDSRAFGGGGSGLGVTYTLYAPVRNGEQFVVATGGRTPTEASPVSVVLDWTSLLKK